MIWSDENDLTEIGRLSNLWNGNYKKIRQNTCFSPEEHFVILSIFKPFLQNEQQIMLSTKITAKRFLSVNEVGKKNKPPSQKTNKKKKGKVW